MKRFITLFSVLLFSISFSQIDYDTQIQPIFDTNCVSCHSNGAAYTGGIELTSYDDLMAGGYTTDNTNVLSVLEEYVITGYMPAWGADPLSDEEIELISQWISQGANPSGGDCILSDGSIVPNGWSGNGVGNNWCNSCFCENGMLSCTEMWCECEIDLDNDGVCDDIDECVGTWIEDIITGSCLDLNNESSCVAAGCSWTNEYTGVWLWEDVCGYQGNSTYVVEDNSYCDQLTGGCVSDIDEDGICEDNCEEIVTIIEDCECEFFNPNTYTVFYTTVDEASCTLIETCYCECINDINQNFICDEEEEGCWEDGEFYDVYTQLFVDECNYYECVVSSGFFWSELMTIDGCVENDCPCINPDWIDPFAICPMIYDPVIGCDGIEYANSCIAQAAGVTSWIDEFSGEETVLEWDCDIVECVAELDPECMYMTVVDPVCGCDGVTYSNSGEAACNNIFEYTPGPCESVEEGCWEEGEFYAIGSEYFLTECEYIWCEGINNWSAVQVIEGCGEPIECEAGEALLTLNWAGAVGGQSSFTVTGETNGFLYSATLGVSSGSLQQCWDTSLQADCFLIDINGPDGLEWDLYSPLSTETPILSGSNESLMFGSQCDGCTENGQFYDIGSEIYLNECQYIYCEDIGAWSETVTIEECDGCIMGDEFYCIGCELFISDCEYIECEGNQNWSDSITTDCNQTEGCTDETACNYMASATIDDNSCVYDGDPECEDCGTILDFTNYGNNEYFQETYYAPPGLIITINFSGTTETNYDQIIINGELFQGSLDGVIVGGDVLELEWSSDGSVDSNSGYGWSAELICEEPIEGCTQPYADNYNPDANTDDGSCILDCEYFLSYDSYLNDFNTSSYYCGLYVSQGTYTIEQALSFGYNCDCVIIGCMDENATNYDENATIETNCICEYEEVCTIVSVTGGSFPTEVSWDIENDNGDIVLSGGAPYCENFCFEDGCYTINMNDSYGDGWNNAVLTIGEYNYTFTTGSYAIAPFGYNNDDCIVEGCTNALADNYNEEANYDDGSCEYSCEYLLTYESYQDLGFDNSVSNYYCAYYLELGYYTIEEMIDMGYNCDCVIVGCTDEEATNYDEEAFIDDCSCVYENNCPSISFNTTDSSLGWSISNMDGEIIIEYNSSGQEIGSYCGNYCFEEGCYIINMTSLWGGGWYQTTLDIGDESFTLVNGYDGIEAFAYNTDMNCEIGCTDPEASNYNPDAILDDGSCVVFGCTITSACNYDPEATAFDGSCYYCYMDDCDTYPSDSYDCDGNCFNAPDGYDCDGNCLSGDSDGDGVCDEFEIEGCTDTLACNYNPSATEHVQGDCIYPEEYYDCNGNCLIDTDNDGVCNEFDNCPSTYNPEQEDFDNDGTGDECDGISLNENDSFEWTIYPNPFKNYTNIKFTNPRNTKITIEIMSLSGQSIYTAQTWDSAHQIINNFSSGYYIIQLESDNAIVRETLIVQ